MSDDAEIVPMPERPMRGSVDRSQPVPPRSRAEILREGLLVLPHLVLLLFRLLKDPVVPMRRKIVAGTVAAYVVSPIDLVPDSLPVLGSVDDLLLVALAIDHLIKGLPPDTVDRHWPGSEDAFELVSGLVSWGAELVPAPVRRFVGHWISDGEEGA